MLTKEEFYNRLWYLNTQGKDIVRGVADDLRGAFGSEQEQPTDERPPQPDEPPTETPEEARRRREGMWGDWAQGAGDMVAKGWNQLASMAPEKTQAPWRGQQLSDRTSPWEARLRYPSKTSDTWNDIAMTDERALEEELAKKGAASAGAQVRGIEGAESDPRVIDWATFDNVRKAYGESFIDNFTPWGQQQPRSAEAQAGENDAGNAAWRSQPQQEGADAVAAARRLDAQVQGAQSTTATEPDVATIAATGPTWEEEAAVQQPVADTWEAEFARVHGRAPSGYDAFMRDEMPKWLAMQGRTGQEPNRGDWEALTRAANKRGVYGPRDIPEFAAGYGTRANEPRAVQPTVARQQQATTQTATPGQQGQTGAQQQSNSPKATTVPSGLLLNSTAVQKYQSDIEDRAQAYGIDPKLIVALIQAESGFNPQATGKAGEVGLMQLMPATARGLGLTDDSFYHERSNIDAGTKYLASQFKQYAGIKDKNGIDQQLPLALAAYNMGGANLNAVLRGEMQMPASTRAYVKAIMDLYEQMGR